MNKIILIGGGGHCRSIIDVIEQEARFEIAGIIDKSKQLGSLVLGYPIIGDDNELENLSKKYEYALIAVGQIKAPLIRINLYNLAIKYGFQMPYIISPKAYVSKHAKIGNGTVVMHDSIVNANSVIGENCIINSKALIEHDCTILNHCHISTNATINGGVTIEEECFIGSNSTIVEMTRITKNSFIKAGILFK
jgi:sugar O-acyltransferase (sialic acid O-acetyltransferase NeuD family)